MRVHLFGYYFNDILARVSLKEELLQVATSAKQQCQSHLPCYSKLESWIHSVLLNLSQIFFDSDIKTLCFLKWPQKPKNRPHIFDVCSGPTKNLRYNFSNFVAFSRSIFNLNHNNKM